VLQENNTTTKHMEKKQTAIEWLEKEFNKLEATVGVYGIMYSLIDQAKLMEKEQHGTTWDDALKQVEQRTVWARAMCDFDEYYEETYKK